MLINNEKKFFSCSIIFAVLLYAVAIATGDNSYYYVALAMTSLLPVLGVLVIKLNEDVFSPLYLVLYMLFFSVLLKTIYLTFFGSLYARLISLDGRNIDILEKGLLVLILGVFSLCAGYLVFGKKNKERPQTLTLKPDVRLVKWSRVKILVAVTILVSIAFNVVFIAEMNIIGDILQGKVSVKRVHQGTVGSSARGSALTYIRWGAQTLPQVVLLCSVFVYKISQRKIEKPMVAGLVALFFLAAIIPIVTSARLELAYAVILLLMVIHYGGRKVRLKSVVILGAFVLICVAVLGLVRQSQTSASQVDFGVESALDRTLGSGYLMDVAKTSVVVDSVPSKVDYLLGESFTLVFFAPIPRTLWPGKPVVRISKFVGEEIYTRADDSGIPPGFIAEAYMNFGYVGVVILLFALGAVLSKLYTELVLKTKSVFSRVWYAVGSLLLTFTLLSGDFTILVSQFVRFGLIVFMVQWLVSFKVKRRV